MKKKKDTTGRKKETEKKIRHVHTHTMIEGERETGRQGEREKRGEGKTFLQWIRISDKDPSEKHSYEHIHVNGNGPK